MKKTYVKNKLKD
ncbi:hypothetical protein RDI58_007393 [Solanum bulbocastanum]|uniref:Uncharacterized protein n=1 Tax=Solanum bulbocastanum TaxID=147425 RepID=A0AAN8TTY1_SOLBU